MDPSRGQAYVEPNGVVRRMIGSLTDIASRKLNEERMRAAQERYRHLFQYNPLPVIVYECETFGILAVNQAAESVYGYSRGELLHLAITDLIPERLRERASQRLRGLNEFPYRSAPFENLRKDGQKNSGGNDRPRD